MAVATDPVVDVDVKRHQEAMGSIFDQDLYPVRIMLMVKKGCELADKADRRFEEAAVERDRSVLVYPAGGAFSEVVLHVLGSFPDEMDVFEVAFKRSLFGRGMDSGMVVFFDPLLKSLIKILKACFFRDKRQELAPQCLEPAFDLPSLMYSCT